MAMKALTAVAPRARRPIAHARKPRSHVCDWRELLIRQDAESSGTDCRRLCGWPFQTALASTTPLHRRSFSTSFPVNESIRILSRIIQARRYVRTSKRSSPARRGSRSHKLRGNSFRFVSSAGPRPAARRFVIITPFISIGQTIRVQLIKSLVVAPGPNIPLPEPLP